MIEVILFLLCLSLLGYHAWYVFETDKQKNKLVDALVAKSATELRDLRIAENTKIKVEQPKNSNFVPIENIDDETLIKLTKQDQEDVE